MTVSYKGGEDGLVDFAAGEFPDAVTLCLDDLGKVVVVLVF